MELPRLNVVFDVWQCDKENHGWREGPPLTVACEVSICWPGLHPPGKVSSNEKRIALFELFLPESVLTIGQLFSANWRLRSAEDCCRSRRPFATVWTAAEVGLLTRSDVRLAAGWIRIPRLKNPASEYPLLPAEIRALRAWFRVRGRGPGPLYPSRHRSPISRRRLDSLMKQYCRTAGIAAAKAHFHVLKQSCAEHVRKRLGDDAIVRDWLGYEDTLSPMGYQFRPKNRREATADRLKDLGAPAA